MVPLRVLPRVLALALLGSCSASPKSSTGRYVPIGDIGVRSFDLRMRDLRLPSGLRVLVEEDHRSPIVGVVTVIGAGGSRDPSGKEGLANLAARLTLRARPSALATLRAELERAGAGLFHAFADLDATVFSTFAPKGALADLLRLESTRLLYPAGGLDPAQVAIERDVIASELRARHEAGDPMDLVPLMQAALFPQQHPYARPPVGTEGSLARISLSDVQAFMRQHYRAENVTMLILGDVDPELLGGILASSLHAELIGDPAHPAALPPSTTAAAAQPPDPPPARPGLVPCHADVQTPEIWIGWSLPSSYRRGTVPPQFLADVIANTLAQQPRGQEELAQQLRTVTGDRGAPAQLRPERLRPRARAPEMLGPAPDPALCPTCALNPETVLAFMTSLSGLPPPTEDTDIERVDAFQVPGGQATLLVCRVKLREGSHPDHSAENVLDRLRQMWYRTSPSREYYHFVTVQLTRAAVVARMILDAEDPVERGLLTAQWAHLGSDPRMYSRTLASVLETSPGQIEDFAWDYLTRKRARMLYVTPVRSGPLPARLPAGGRTLAAAELAERPVLAPAAIGDLGRPLDVGGFRTRKLANGVEVIAARKTGIPVLTLGMTLYGGTATERPLGVVEVAAHVAKVGHRFGKPSDYGAHAWGENAPDAISFHLRSGADHVGKMLAILSDRVKNQAVPGGAVDDFRKYTMPLLAKQEQTPLARADLAFWKAMYGDHPYARRASTAELSRIGSGDVARWLRWAYRPDNATVVVVGDFDPERALELADYWLSDWKSEAHLPKGEVSVEFQPLGKAPPPPVRPPGSTVLTTHRPGATQAQLRFGCLLPETSDERRAVAYDLAAQILERRLDDAIRGQLGAGSEVHGRATMLAGGTSSLVASASVASGDLGTVLRVLGADRDRLAGGGFTEGELDRARWTLARRYELHYTTTQAIVEAVLEARKRGFDIASIERYPTHLAMATRSEVQAAFSACRERDVLSLVGDEPTLRAAIASGWPTR